ncbi:vesicular integral-membrane protein VIP36 isoform X2 [Hydra vulgaris]|uniref:Vesicular integral-membrane protein VIP36 isoform X2 n=1 Tax=Hydra vulgaris TaxID=6087 RepID=A0ABM4BYH2_HYDVU
MALLLLLIKCVIIIVLCFKICSFESDSDVNLEPTGYMRREYSLIKPFHALQYWEILGSTMVSVDYLRLTPDERSKAGSVWNILPCYIRNWEIHINFKIHGHGTRLYGDGFAFWYSKERAQPGPVFGNKDYFTGLALFFDTYANQNGEHQHEHPYISAQVSNGSIHYDHDRDGTHTQLAGCSVNFRGVAGETHVAIRYLGSKKRLTVQYDIDNDDSWKECLDKYGVEMPTGYYFGLSAQTGDLSDNHDILSMKFYELENEEEEGDYSNIIPNSNESEPNREHVDDPSKPSTRREQAMNWLLAILLFVTFAGGLSFYFYQKKQNDMKRFY